MNTNKYLATTIVVGALFHSPLSLAQDDNASMFDGWSGTATLGATSASGNAESSNVNGSIRLGKKIGSWEHVVLGSIFKGSSTLVIDRRDELGNIVFEDDGVTPQRQIVKGDNSDRLALGYKPKYFYRPNIYFFGILDYEQDKPGNIDSATRQILGVGYEFYRNSTGFLSADIGFGNKNTDLVVGESVDGGVGYLGLDFLSRINDNITFNADLRSDFGSDNTFVEMGLGIAFKLSEKLALKIAHFSRSNSDLGSGENPLDSNSDSITSLNLVIDI